MEHSVFMLVSLSNAVDFLNNILGQNSMHGHSVLYGTYSILTNINIIMIHA